MIDAFYSFDADRLRPILAKAGDAQGRILGYQGWAEGGNYIVVERAPCAPQAENKVDCAITVQDDPVVALETGFNVTDTFHLTFEGSDIVDVKTSSNDQPIYYEARQWVEENMPEVMSGPCRREEGLRVTPGDCARAMTDGYRKFLEARKAAAAATENSAFVPSGFEVPVEVDAGEFKLVPLGPELVDLDYEAYMSSIEHLQRTFTRSTDWPHEDIDADAAMQDMLNEQSRFERRVSFAYGVLSADAKRERGCVYIRPSSKDGYDAEVSLWVTKAEFDAGFDASLYQWTQEWIAQEWPFTNVAFPGRAIEWEAWDAL
ncbi:MAG: hypothetical protein V2I82_09840 [Halieaceae bacterium]|nr:hypothetical protein [Halieaceae bacterium]